MLQPSPLTEITSRDLRKKGEHKKTMKDALVLEIGGYWTAERSTTSRSPKAHCRLPLRLRPSVNTLCPIVSSDALDGGGLY
jgi:hypothetical protein